jgi:hypothetical protein
MEIEYKDYVIWEFEGDWYMRVKEPSEVNSFYGCMNSLNMVKFLIDLMEEVNK